MLALGSDAARDQWLVVDDGSDVDPFVTTNLPAMAFLFEGENSATRASEAAFNTDGDGRATFAWGPLAIPPGGTMAVVHFVAQQLSRAGAIAAAERLAAMPSEAMAGLSTEELSWIDNFAMPADGTSTYSCCCRS